MIEPNRTYNPMPASPNPFADDPLPGPTPGEVLADPLNPYASPAGSHAPADGPGPGVGIWRHNDLVVLHRSISFPLRCIWTNEPANSRYSATVSQNIFYPSPQETILVEYSLSAPARRQVFSHWLRGLGIGVGVAATMLVPSIVAEAIATTFSDLPRWGILLGALLGVGSIVFALTRGGPLKLVHRDGPYFVLSGARAPFLKSLPRWPGMIVS